MTRLDARASMACHEYLHKLHAPNRFNLVNLADETPMAKALRLAGEAHEKNVVELLLSIRSDVAVIEETWSNKSREQKTVEALLNQNINAIIQPVFGELTDSMIHEKLGIEKSETNPRSSRPDLLVRWSLEPAPFGTWAPVDIKSHSATTENKSNEVFVSTLNDMCNIEKRLVERRLDRDDALQLAHYHRHLQHLDLATKDGWAGIIGKDAITIHWAKLPETTFGRGKNSPNALSLYDLGFTKSLEIVDAAIARNNDETLPAPSIAQYDGSAKMCKTCSFFPVCINELIEYKKTGDITLLATVTPTIAETELGYGISIGEVLELQPPLSQKLEPIHQRARVYRGGIPEIKIGVDDFFVPTFDIEIDIDLENSQGALQELGMTDEVGADRLYLYGYIKHELHLGSRWEDSSHGTFEDYSGTPEGEHSVYLRMWQYLQTEIDSALVAGKTIGVFHYSPHERTWWRRWIREFSDFKGTPSEHTMEQFLDKYFVDLYPIAQKVVFPPNKKSPICDYSIKTLAPLAGFSWSADDAGGANSLLKYAEATASNSDAAEAAQEWLRKYNVDDVKATMAFRNWLRKLDLK